jgi:hypothetical protein
MPCVARASARGSPPISADAERELAGARDGWSGQTLEQLHHRWGVARRGSVPASKNLHDARVAQAPATFASWKNRLSMSGWRSWLQIDRESLGDLVGRAPHRTHAALARAPRIVRRRRAPDLQTKPNDPTRQATPARYGSAG